MPPETPSTQAGSDRSATDASDPARVSSAVDGKETPVYDFPDGHAGPLPVYEIADDTYLVLGMLAQADGQNRGLVGNASFLVTDEGVVMIDAAGSPRLGERLIDTVRSITDKEIRYLIVTHHHPDHYFGASAFRKIDGLQVVIHEAYRDYVAGDVILGTVQHRQEVMAEDMKGFEIVHADIEVGGEIFSSVSIRLAGQDLDIYNVGNVHTGGDLVVHHRQGGVLWTSDLAFNNRVTYMADGNSRQAIESMRWVLEKFGNAKLMIPGHGTAQTKPFPMIRETIAYMEALREKMRQFVMDGVDLLDAVERSDLPDWKGFPLYGVTHRANANFVYREIELEEL